MPTIMPSSRIGNCRTSRASRRLTDTTAPSTHNPYSRYHPRVSMRAMTSDRLGEDSHGNGRSVTFTNPEGRLLNPDVMLLSRSVFATIASAPALPDAAPVRFGGAGSPNAELAPTASVARVAPRRGSAAFASCQPPTPNPATHGTTATTASTDARRGA